MQDLNFFHKRTDYLDFLHNDVFVEPELPRFYRNLIDWVADHRAPIFYKISHPSEHFAFSGAYHFETRRERYPNATRECLFWLHDFTHMLFEYPHDLLDVSEKQFIDLFWHQERIASTETEIFSYYREPKLREKVFPDEKLWYDVLVEKAAPKIAAWEFVDYRERVQMEDDFGEEELGDHPEILKWIRSWRKLTPKFCNQRYRSIAGVRVTGFPWARLNVFNYEDIIENYKPKTAGFTQDDYERTVMANVRMAYDILGWEDPPLRWRHMPDAIDSLEGAVFFHG